MQWQTDTKAEIVLKKEGVSYVYQMVSASEIDVKASRVNRARPVPVNEDAAEDYAKAALDGDAFPAIVLAKVRGHANSKYIIAGGNHRHRAFVEMNGETEVYAICIEVDEITFDLVCKSLNTVEGQRADRSLKVQQAVDWVLKYNTSIKEAAAKMRVSQTAVQMNVRAEKVRSAAVAEGVNLNGGCPSSHLERIFRYKDDTNVLKPLAKVVKKGVTRNDLDSLLSEIADCKTESQRVSAIERFEKDKTPQKRSITRTEYSRLLESIGRLERLLKKSPTASQLQVTAENREEAARRWQKVRDHLDEVLIPGSQTSVTTSRQTHQ